MAGKRLLDVAALFNASRGVVRKHIGLRSRQLEVYGRTSTIARAIRNQTDRVTESVKAASFLVSRLNEDAPARTKDEDARPIGEDKIPSKKSTTGPLWPHPKDGIDQDHFYEKSVENSAADETPSEDLHIRQDKADRYPLPDGTIPPNKSDLNSEELDHEIISDVPRDGTSKNPLSRDGIEPVSSGESTIPRPVENPNVPKLAANVHDKKSRFLKVSLDSDSLYTREDPDSIPSSQSVPEPEQVPEGVNTDLFYSLRVARVLGKNTIDGKRAALRSEAAANRPIEHSFLSKDKDQDTFNVRSSVEGAAAIGVGQSSVDRPSPLHLSPKEDSTESLANDISKEVNISAIPVIQTDLFLDPGYKPHELQESKVPSTRLSRIWNYGGLAVGMFGGAIGESLRRVTGSGGQGSYMLSEGNMERLVTKLSRMRGAALKLGQMISFQDSKMLPAAVQEVLQRVQDRADYMPASQRDKVLTANLGADWRNLFTSFDEKPIAAASIGQVHKAVLSSNGARVAVKIQYPGVADSIDSDLSNLEILLTAARILPKGLFLDKTIANARTELSWECDYIREAECGQRFEGLLADEEDVFLIPKVYPEASGRQVLTMEFMDGIGVTRVQSFSQKQKDWIGTQILRLCLREITEFRFMQTDPNWTNFLYNSTTKKLELLDFGASREYPTEFISKYTKLLAAASRSDRQTVRDLSVDLGYLTGHESSAMLNAHIASVLTLAEPFLDSSPEVYDFKDQTITDRVKEQIPLMIRERLAPPPEETYSLHRKLSGAFLLCARLGSRVRCRELFQQSMSKAGLIEA